MQQQDNPQNNQAEGKATKAFITLIREYTDSLKEEVQIEGMQPLNEEIKKWEEILIEIEAGALKGIELQMAIDFFMSSVFSIVTSIVLNTASVATWANPNSPAALRVLAGLVNFYEAITLIPFIPAAGVAGVVRTSYMGLRRVFPYILNGYKEKNASKIKEGVLMLIGLNLDGGYFLTPPITASTIASEKLPGFDMKPLLWKANVAKEQALGKLTGALSRFRRANYEL